VLDPYAGSGTTLAVAHRMGRGFIGIDAGPVAIATTLERLGGMVEASPLERDAGVRVRLGAR
jgi:DNA modification methylase